MARNTRDDEVMSNDLSSNVDRDISSSLEPIKVDDDIDQKDTFHIARARSQRDDDYQLHTLVNEVSGVCEVTVSLEAIPSLSALLQLGELSVEEFDQSL